MPSRHCTVRHDRFDKPKANSPTATGLWLVERRNFLVGRPRRPDSGLWFDPDRVADISRSQLISELGSVTVSRDAHGVPSFLRDPRVVDHPGFDRTVSLHLFQEIVHGYT